MGPAKTSIHFVQLLNQGWQAFWLGASPGRVRVRFGVESKPRNIGRTKMWSIESARGPVGVGISEF